MKGKTPLKIIYQDEYMVVVSKPSGLIVHRTRESQDRVFLLQELAYQVDRYLYPVHRLDRSSSGIVAFALTKEAARNLQKNLQSSETIKQYITLVRGSTPDRWEVEHPLFNEIKVKQEAKTHFEKISEFSLSDTIKAYSSLVKARIFTGRRHQIRRHLSHCAHQIIGDTTYGKGRINLYWRETYQLKRLFLHATSLKIDHPISGERLEFSDPLPDDLRNVLQQVPTMDKDLLEKL